MKTPFLKGEGEKGVFTVPLIYRAIDEIRYDPLPLGHEQPEINLGDPLGHPYVLFIYWYNRHLNVLLLFVEFEKYGVGGMRIKMFKEIVKCLQSLH